jgi:hypothetical protein
MKVYKFIIAFFIVVFIYSCGSGDNPGNDEKTQLIEDVENDGFKYIGPAQTQNGIWDTLMLGYTDRENGVYHNTSERFEKLKIRGYEFEEVSDELYKSVLLIYCFEFDDSEEEKKFEKFQKYILNYQRHSKNQVEFYQKNEKWILRLEPMP